MGISSQDAEKCTRRQAIVHEFMEMVQIDAASGKERQVADFLKTKLAEIGCDVHEDGAGEILGGDCGNVYAALDGGAEGAILFSSHMDRVPNGIGIKPRIEGGRIVPSGTILAADDLAGAAAILDGLRALKARGKPFPRIEALFTVREETGLLGSLHVDYGRIKAKFGYVLDSSGRIGRIINSAPAVAKFTIQVHGKAAHAGNEPEKGKNAVIIAAKLLSGARDGRLDEESTANFSSFEASGPSNIVSAYARVEGEMRSRNQRKLEANLEELRRLCEKAAAAAGAKIECDTRIDFKSFCVEKTDAVIRRLEAVFQDMGVTSLVEGGGGGMDANRFNEHGITCVGVATGYKANHTTEEELVIEDLVLSGQMVENIVLKYAGEKSGARYDGKS